jgi:hypothetical protein
VPLIRKKAMMKALRAWMPFQPPSSRSIHLQAGAESGTASSEKCQGLVAAEEQSRWNCVGFAAVGVHAMMCCSPAGYCAASKGFLYNTIDPDTCRQRLSVQHN